MHSNSASCTPYSVGFYPSSSGQRSLDVRCDRCPLSAFLHSNFRFARGFNKFVVGAFIATTTSTEDWTGRITVTTRNHGYLYLVSLVLGVYSVARTSTEYLHGELVPTARETAQSRDSTKLCTVLSALGHYCIVVRCKVSIYLVVLVRTSKTLSPGQTCRKNGVTKCRPHSSLMISRCVVRIAFFARQAASDHREGDHILETPKSTMMDGW
jgi:hypothetical protein